MPTSCPVESLQPRLLGLKDSARYVGLSVWAVRGLLDSGELCGIRVPTASGGELRRVLLDRLDLDALIARWKA
jgi:hypothetical protein